MAKKCPRHGGGAGGKGVLLAGAVGAALVMASGAKGAHHGTTASVSAEAVAAAPASTGTVRHAGHVTGMPGGYSVGKWTVWFLSAAHLPDTACDRAAVDGWQAAEDTYAKFRNPLDTERVLPGSWRINDTGNGTGVQEYPTWAEGMKATVITLYNGHYPRIIAALRAGNNAQAVANAVAYPRVWGTGPYSVSC